MCEERLSGASATEEVKFLVGRFLSAHASASLSLHFNSPQRQMLLELTGVESLNYLVGVVPICS
jgi:hypothetical protein